MTIRIRHSVGQLGANKPEDVQKVHQLLYGIPRQFGGHPRPALPNNGTYGVDTTLVAIKRFQWRLYPRRPTPVDCLVEPNGPTLRHMNNLYEGRNPPPALQRPGGTRGRAIPLYLNEIWQLITQNHANLSDVRADHSSVFPKELLVGLFWEETSFINTRGRSNPRMIGFGQVSEDNFRALNGPPYGRSFTPAGVLANDAQSVELASLTLDRARTDGLRQHPPPIPRNRRDSLCYYAHMPTGCNPAVDRWIQCMDMLQAIPVSQYMGGSPITDSNGVAIREALWEARSGSWCPDMALPPDL